MRIARALTPPAEYRMAEKGLWRRAVATSIDGGDLSCPHDPDRKFPEPPPYVRRLAEAWYSGCIVGLDEKEKLEKIADGTHAAH